MKRIIVLLAVLVTLGCATAQPKPVDPVPMSGATQEETNKEVIGTGTQTLIDVLSIVGNYLLIH